MRGFLAVDKPSGRTSHDVVDAVRRITGVRKVGHAGTLDPMATGLLVVAVGPVTRLIRYVQAGRKAYVADVAFGIATDSLDADGAEVERSPMPGLAAEDLEAVLDDFVGRIDQVPPMVSALKRGGVRLHELARRGEEVEREPRPVDVH
jgi:tRNA pseudouridine55 synthase